MFFRMSNIIKSDFRVIKFYVAPKGLYDLRRFNDGLTPNVILCRPSGALKLEALNNQLRPNLIYDAHLGLLQLRKI